MSTARPISKLSKQTNKREAKKGSTWKQETPSMHILAW